MDCHKNTSCFVVMTLSLVALEDFQYFEFPCSWLSKDFKILSYNEVNKIISNY